MSDNIFNASSTPADAQVPAGSAPPASDSSVEAYADLLGSIKNERGERKYKDVQAALEALKHSQEFIPQLKADKEANERRLAEVEAENQRLKTLEATLAALQSGNAPVQNTPAPQGVNPDDVASLVNKALTQRENEARRASNLSQVVSAVREVFGADADKQFYQKAQEMGLSQMQVNNLAAESPQAVLNLFGLKRNTSQPYQAPSQGTVNASSYQTPPQSFIGKNSSTALIGATTSELRQEQDNAKKLVEELHGKGLTTYDLTDPKQYFKIFQ